MHDGIRCAPHAAQKEERRCCDITHCIPKQNERVPLIELPRPTGLTSDRTPRVRWIWWRQQLCGKPIPGIDVRLLDEGGREVPVGMPGEICVSGPLVSLQGYKNRPEETAEALAGGWLHTGDIAKRDEEGSFISSTGART
jgi:acyl-CoA synthetase (AMP-forming)/AMP-acid ligase II